MEEKEFSFWKKVIIGIEALVGLLVIFVLCTIFSILISYVTIYACNGECTIELFEEYSGYVKVGYGVFLSVCVSLYIKHLADKYKSDDKCDK
jgi:hypothetical protein